MDKKFVCFGEIMLRISPPGFQRLGQTSLFEIAPGGGEANVAVSLANFGKNSCFVTKLPKHAIGDWVVQTLRKYGVNTSFIVRGGERVGIYFCEKGASQRPSQVIYDRSHAAITSLQNHEVDWSKIFQDAGWFHVTGITPALSESCAQRTLEALEVARKQSLTLSCDLNYRKKLWSKEHANQTMSKIAGYCDVLIGNEEDAESVFGIKADRTNIHKGELDCDSYVDVAKQLMKKFSVKYVAITLRESLSASDNRWSGLLYDGKEPYFSRKYHIRIVDRVGGGDAFAAGLIYSLSEKRSCQESVEFAAAASCLKHSIEGDFNLVSLQEVETLLKGDGSGRVQR